jgi:hypothetical protein
MKKTRKETKSEVPWERSAEEQLRIAYRILGEKYEALKKIVESAPEPHFSVHLQYSTEVWMRGYSKWFEDLRGVIRSTEGE